jgi:hypothetical protein
MSKKPRRSPTPRDREVEILTNPKLPRRLRLIDGRTGGVVLAVEDAPAGVMSWFEIEQAWLKPMIADLQRAATAMCRATETCRANQRADRNSALYDASRGEQP